MDCSCYFPRQYKLFHAFPDVPMAKWRRDDPPNIRNKNRSKRSKRGGRFPQSSKCRVLF